MTENRDPIQAEVELTIKGDIQRLRLRPRDILVVRLHNERGYSGDQIEQIAEQARQFLRRVGFENEVIVLAREVSMQVIGPNQMVPLK